MKDQEDGRVVPDFSVVVPVSARDMEMVPRTLPVYLKLRAKEILICVDSPLDPELRKAIDSASKGDPRLRVVEVQEDDSWKFRQALVRRSGFRAAANDRILTGDVDVLVNDRVLAAVDLVGQNNVGVANLQKEMRRPRKHNQATGQGDQEGVLLERVVRLVQALLAGHRE
jgi:hypothetical protein